MKRLNFLLLAAVALLAAGCDDPYNGNGGNGIHNLPEITFPATEDTAPSIVAEGGTAAVSFTALTDWTVSVKATKAGEWIAVSPMNGKAGDARITITVRKNEGEESREAVITIQCEHDSREIKVSQESPRGNGDNWLFTNYWKRTDRQQMGLMGPVKTYTANTLPHTVYEFDQAGRLLKESRYDEEDRLSSVWICSYDAKGRLVRKECKDSYDGFSAVQECEEYEYGNEGLLVPVDYVWYGMDTLLYNIDTDNWWYRKSFMWDLSLVRRVRLSQEYATCSETSYTFGTGDNLTIKVENYQMKRAEFDGKGFAGSRNGSTSVQSYPVTYKGRMPYECNYLDGVVQRYGNWQENGMPSEFFKQTPPGLDGAPGRIEFACAFDRGGRYLALSNFSLMDGSSAAYSFGRNMFNEHGDIASSIHATEGGPSVQDKYDDYAYDKYGNWTSRTEYLPATLGENAQNKAVSRTFTYFE